MKKIKTIIAIAFMLCAFCSCQTKSSAINELRTFNQELKLSSQNYSIEDWKKAGMEYHKINQHLKKHVGKYNDAEFQEISQLNLECAQSFKEGAITKVKGATQIVKSFIEGLFFQ